MSENPQEFLDNDDMLSTNSQMSSISEKSISGYEKGEEPAKAEDDTPIRLSESDLGGGGNNSARA